MLVKKVKTTCNKVYRMFKSSNITNTSIILCFLALGRECFCQDAEEPIDKRMISDPMADEKWVSEVVKDIAYYLRSYKFNEWDRRYFQSKPSEGNLIGYYAAFPEPALRSLHWKVYEHCNSNFYKCITYLHEVIETAPLTRHDDTNTILIQSIIPMNETLRHDLDLECKKGLANSEATGLPFDGPIEKFQWRTTGSYYMCWYTMLETPALSTLEESCDNFAYCLDPDFGFHNRDHRADDKMSFACATYSFCPDLCCPVKFMKDFSSCYFVNPCYAENSANQEKQVCTFDRRNNQNFRDIILNKWNVSCNCEQKGFIWNSQYGMCVDIDECTTGQHTCEPKTEDCLNLPGSYICVCSWDYSVESSKNKCIHKTVIEFSKFSITEHLHGFDRFKKQLLKFFGL